MSVSIYVEGGGHGGDLRTRCRMGFRTFLEAAGFKGRMPAIIACGSRREAFDRFCTALSASPGEVALLLIDSEGPVLPSLLERPWEYLRSRPEDRFDPPPGATDGHVFLMVQCMESWFLADRSTLEGFFRQGFHAASLPATSRPIESIPKDEVLRSLKTATRGCKSKGEYAKSRHSFELLRFLNPLAVRQHCPHCRRLLDTLDRMIRPS